jgi:hypothetical protein
LTEEDMPMVYFWVFVKDVIIPFLS